MIEWRLTDETIVIGGDWLACQHPERPWDDRVAYHIKPICEACGIAMTAHRLNRDRPAE